MDRGYRALVVDDLHLNHFAPTTRNAMLYALCLALGFPTPSDLRRGTLLWDVTPRPLPENRKPTYSEHNGEADLHTDSQCYPIPEALFILYSVRAARCGGGASLFCAVDELENALEQTAEGREARAMLSEASFPFSIGAGEVGPKVPTAVTVAPILGKQPRVRFRREVIDAGFAARPELATRDARRAVEIMVDALQNRARIVRHYLADGALAICNNGALLHGRTKFEDTERHLIRARMSERPVAVVLAELREFFMKAMTG
jgi:alpha-ketoglutarate-dependent taurine dioxygenase